MRTGKDEVSAGVGRLLPSLLRNSLQLAGAADAHHAFLARIKVRGYVGIIQRVAVDAVGLDVHCPRRQGRREFRHIG